MLLLRPDHADLYEVNHCHGLGTKGHPCKDAEAAPKGVVKKAWHLTSDPHFAADPSKQPRLNSLAGDLIENPPQGLFVTDDPEYWMHAHGYEQPYVAEVEGTVTNPPGTVMVNGREEFMQGKVKTLRVLTLDEFARETYGEPGWVEDYFAPQRHFGDKVQKFPKGYRGRPVSEMSPAEIKEWEQKFALYTKRSR